MTTPEQLAKYREEFEKTETNPYLEKTALGMYAVTSIENRWQGYLRRCQETEQAMKLAKFGAYILDHTNSGHDFESSEIWDTAEHYGLLNPGLDAPDSTTEDTIRNLLK